MVHSTLAPSHVKHWVPPVIAQSWWEHRAHAGVQMPNGGFNSSLWSKVMAARFPAEYRDRADIGLGGTPSAPPIAVAPMSHEDAYAIYMRMKDKANG
jgi:hypothetical protein